MQDFKGKTAVITGAGSGIGRGMAIAFARAGMRVVVSDIERQGAEAVAREISGEGGKAIAAVTDVSRLEDVKALAAAADKAFGPVHVLCNNAGVMIFRHGPDATHQDWQWAMGVNLWGVIHGMEAFLPGMRAHGQEAHIVNTASMNGLLPSAHSAMYSTTKYGVLGLSETFALELEGSNVSISVLCPGAVATRIADAERNRPKELVPPTPAGPHQKSMDYNLAPGLDPLLVGDQVLHAMRHKQLHIFTEMRIAEWLQARHERMMAEFDRLREWEKSRS
jgi:NAD(P)-dependent dehydrogenase (short-subunit alcohol dehydrogenase family)